MRKGNKNVVLNEGCHSRGMLSGIFRVQSCYNYLNKKHPLCKNDRYVKDPRTLRVAIFSGMTTNLNNTPSSVPVLQPTGQALTGHLPPQGEVANFNAPSTWRERAECISTGVRGIISRGFTLIELLVVVLIIGVLAAVALPQYQKAVEKSKTTEAITTINAIQKAIGIYALQHGLPTVNPGDREFDLLEESLDIALPNSYSNSKGIEGIPDFFCCYDAKMLCSHSFCYAATVYSGFAYIKAGRIGGKYLIMSSSPDGQTWTNYFSPCDGIGYKLAPSFYDRGYEDYFC